VQDVRRLRLKRSFLVAVAFAGMLCVRGDVLVTTWNMKWFPSGIPDLRNDEAAEKATIARAGRLLADVYREQTRKSGADLIVLAQEVRDAETMSDYARAAGVEGLKVVSVSNFKDGDVPIWQQMAILSTLPVLDAGFATWAKGIGVSIPRGFAYALLDGGEAGPIACFSLHLKSNLNRSGTDIEGQKNIYKREAAAAQVLLVVRKMRDAFPDRELRVIVGGDFNTNDDDLEYVSEATLRSFYGAHFRSCFRDLRRDQKVTRPGTNGFPDATFDYILYRGFERIVSRKIYPGEPLSDHNLVALRLR
jgi:endonuclease/exonuclease/phosphatase family metal-dependent hydrolase